MYLSHPLSVTLCKVIIDRNYMHAFSRKSVKICRTGGYEGLSFTGLHLGYTSLMENDASYELYPEMLHSKDSLRRLPDSGKGLRQYIVQGLSFSQSLLKFWSLCLKLFIGHGRHDRIQGFDLIHYGHDPFQLSVAVRAE